MTDSRVALVTGANRGIGAAIAARLAADGFTVVGTHRGSGVAEGIHGVECDVTDPDSIAALFARTKAEFGRLDLLFNNAGRSAPPVPTCSSARGANAATAAAVSPGAAG